jgi:hypothetical protein
VDSFFINVYGQPASDAISCEHGRHDRETRASLPEASSSFRVVREPSGSPALNSLKRKCVVSDANPLDSRSRQAYRYVSLVIGAPRAVGTASALHHFCLPKTRATQHALASVLGGIAMRRSLSDAYRHHRRTHTLT